MQVMSAHGRRLIFKQEQINRLLSEYDNQTILPGILQDISRKTRMNYASVKIQAKKHNIKVKRAW